MLPVKSAAAGAIQYAFNRWDALLTYAEDGVMEMDNNAAERALLGVALGRQNYLFIGSDPGDERAAALQPDRGRQTRRSRSRSVPTACVRPYRRPPSEPSRGPYRARSKNFLRICSVSGNQAPAF
jgi:hypothetical protein